jgi:hypothetical protein
MDWNCTLSEERLSDHLEGHLSPEESAAFSAHVAGCRQCAQLVARVQGLVGRLRSLEPLEAPPRLANNIIRATLGSRPKRWFSWAPVLWQPRFAMGALTVATSFAIVVHAAGLTPARLRHADLSPSNLYRTANRQVHLTYARGAKFVNDLRVVYEIQSRLQPEQEPAAAPSAVPAPAQPSQPPPATPQQKSEQKSRDRSQVRAGGLVAVLLPDSLPGALLGVTTRSL